MIDAACNPCNAGYIRKYCITVTNSDLVLLLKDFGQKRIGATQCEVCGMTYTIADAVDEATHTKFHERLLNALKFPVSPN